MSFIEETNVSTSLSAQIKTQLDAKLSNCYMNPDNYTMVVEDIAGYLSRVIPGARTAATLVAMLLPKAGFIHVGIVEYDYDSFDAIIENYDQKYYTFVGGFQDIHFVEVKLFPDFVSEIAIGEVNGVNKIFASTYDFIDKTVTVFKNGLKQKKTDFTIISANQIELLNSPLNIGYADEIEITYYKK